MSKHPFGKPFLKSLLDRWLNAAADASGLFHPYLDRQWNRIDAGPLTLVSRCRLIYNFCRGSALFQDARYGDAADRGLAALQTHFRIAPGRYRWAVTGRGEEVDATPDAYGHAFCILALATAAEAFGDPALAARALETWQYVSDACTDEHGGLIWRVGDSSEAHRNARSQNPLMHAFEALMALHAVDPTGRARSAAQELLAFLRALDNFEAGMLVERHTLDWKPQPVERGGVVDLGHQFEWAFLLSDWHRITQDPDALQMGAAFLRTGVEVAVDMDGGVRASCDPSGRIVSAAKGLWQQCEAIRALSRYVTAHGHSDVDAVLQRTLSFFQSRFVDAEYGGVFASPEGTGGTVSLDKGNPWKLDYHTVNMCLERIKAGEGA